MDRSIAVLIFSLALLYLQSTQAAELNSESTLNCNGKDFKCVNSTHYQPCSLTERSGQTPQYLINGETLACLDGNSCSDENTVNCAVARTVQPVNNDQLSQIPVEVTVVNEQPAVSVDKSSETELAKSLIADEIATPTDASVVEPAASSVAPTVAPASIPKESAEDAKPVESTPAKKDLPTEDASTATTESSASDISLKAEKAEKAEKSDAKNAKKKFSFKGLKKVGPIRLVNGFRSSTLRPKIALDEQKDVADDVRQWLYERRNKYEKFVDRVLGRASPITTKKTSESHKGSEVLKNDEKPADKKDEPIVALDESKTVTEQVVTVIKSAAISPAQRDVKIGVKSHENEDINDIDNTYGTTASENINPGIIIIDLNSGIGLDEAAYQSEHESDSGKDSENSPFEESNSNSGISNESESESMPGSSTSNESESESESVPSSGISNEPESESEAVSGSGISDESELESVPGSGISNESELESVPGSDCDERTGSKACSAGSDFDGNNEGESSNEEESDDMGGSSDAASKESSESESGGDCDDGDERTGRQCGASGNSSGGDSDCDEDDSCDDDYDSCDEEDSCDDEEDEDECDDSDDSCESDDDDDDDDDDCESELAPGEGEAVWEEQQVQGGVEIVEECPDEESDDCEDDDSCESDESNDYEYESGIEETVEVADGDDCDDDSCDEETSCEDDDSCADSATEDCDDDDDECKKRKKQSHDKKKKKKSGQKKKKKKTSGSKKADDKQKDKKKSVEKKRIRYPPVQKIRNQYARALQNVTDTAKPGTRIGGGGSGSSSSSSSSSSGSSSSSTSSSSGGSGGGIGMGLQNAVLNKVDSLLAIKEQGLFNRGGNSDTNTGCSIVEGWSCPLPRGKYAHPIDCQKYVMCSRSGLFSRETTNTVYECEDDEAYDPKQRSCTTDWSSCEALEQCLYNRQLIEDPSDETSYFICIRDSNKLKESYSMYRRSCTQDRVFDPDYQLCIDCDDSEKLNKAKKKRAQIKKQKECKKKKAQKKKKKDKKKSQKKSKNQAHKTSQKKN